MRNLVVVIRTDHPNDIESGILYRDAFSYFGYIVEEVSVSRSESVEKLALLIRDRADEIFCFVSDNYTGTLIRSGRALLHHFTNIPLVIWLHDHPLYFTNMDSPELSGTIMFVPGAEAEFVTKYYVAQAVALHNSGQLPQFAAAAVPARDSFMGRTNSILAPMNLHVNGQTIDVLWAHVKQLPAIEQSFVRSLIDAALTDTTRPLHAWAENLLASMTQTERTAAVTHQLVALEFIKLWRRHQMIETLVELPILISSEYVPARLEFKFPKKFTKLSMKQTLALYETHRFVLNSHPISHAFHDRIIHALKFNAVCITDVNAIFAHYFRDGYDFLAYDFLFPDMASKIGAFIDDAERAFELTVHAHATMTASPEVYTASMSRLLEVVGDRWNAVTSGALGPLVGA